MTPNTHAGNFKKILEAASALQGMPNKPAASAIQSKLMPALEKQVANTRGPVRKLYESTYNSLASIVDGLKTDEVSKTDYKEFLRELAAYGDRAHQIETAPPRNPERAMDNDAWLMQQAEHGARVLTKYKPYESTLPRTLAKRFLATRMPVLALTDPVLGRDKLNDLKLLDETFFGYPILKNQVVLGIAADWIVSEYKRDFDEAIKDISDILEQQTNKKFLVLGAPRKRGLVYWAWMVTSQDMQKLNKAAFSGHFALKAWSFPFEAGEIINQTEQKQALIREAKEKYPSLRT